MGPDFLFEGRVDVTAVLWAAVLHEHPELSGNVPDLESQARVCLQPIFHPQEPQFLFT